jgi:uncharacterized protein YkwD
LVLTPFWSALAQTSGAPVSPTRVLINAINAVRVVEKRVPLTINTQLTAAANAHAVDMAERGYFGHQDPEGHGLQARLVKARYPYHLALEIIAVGQRDPRIVLAEWLDSADHHKNLLDRNVRDIGVAHLYYPSDPAVSRHRHYWVVVLGLAETPRRQEQTHAKH